MAAMTENSSLSMFEALQDAVQMGAYRSAVALAETILIQSPSTRTPLKNEDSGYLLKPGSTVLVLELCADAHFGLREFHCAISYYTQAEKLLTRKIYPTVDGSSGLGLGGVVGSPGDYTPTTNGSGLPPRKFANNTKSATQKWSETPEAQKVYEVLFKCSKAYVEAKNTGQARILLEKIPDKYRTTKVSLALANLYHIIGSTRAAIAEYKKVWKANPFMIESAKKLIDLDVSPEEVLNMVESFFEEVNAPWLKSLVMAYGHEVNHRAKKGIEVLEKLGTGVCEKKTQYLLQKARLAALLHDNETALELFSRAHSDDETSLTDMDAYARVLYERNDSVRLNRLTQKLLQLDSTRVEGWISAAYYTLLKRKFDKALSFVEQAIVISNLRSYNAYICKGEILMMGSKEKQHVHMEAINAFKKAWGLKRGILACKGLVPFLKDGNTGQAKGFAACGINMPESDSGILLGSVYAHIGQRDCKATAKILRKLARI